MEELSNYILETLMSTGLLQKTSTDKLERAITIATYVHRNQKRRSGKKYIVHPFAVMNIVKKLKGSLTQQIIAILHDTLEDVDTNNSGLKYTELKSLIKTEFGNTVVNGVERLNLKTSSDNKFSLEDVVNISKRMNCKYDDKLLLKILGYVNSIYSILQDKTLSIVKMADIISNLEDNPTTKQRQKYCTSLNVIGNIDNNIIKQHCKVVETFLRTV